MVKLSKVITLRRSIGYRPPQELTSRTVKYTFVFTTWKCSDAPQMSTECCYSVKLGSWLLIPLQLLQFGQLWLERWSLADDVSGIAVFGPECTGFETSPPPAQRHSCSGRKGKSSGVLFLVSKPS